jgi:hypothetical protein
MAAKLLGFKMTAKNKYIVWAEYNDGSYFVDYFPTKTSVKVIYDWYEKYGQDKVKRYGWSVDDDRPELKIIKKKAKKM